MRDAFATIKLIDPLLDCGQELDSLGDLVKRSFIRQLLDRLDNSSFGVIETIIDIP
jgi:hypothetical protein